VAKNLIKNKQEWKAVIYWCAVNVLFSVLHTSLALT